MMLILDIMKNELWKKGALGLLKRLLFPWMGFNLRTTQYLAEIRGAKWPGLFQYQIKSTDRPPNHFCNVIKAQDTPIRIFDLV